MTYKKIEYVKAYHYFGYKLKHSFLAVNRIAWMGGALPDNLVREYKSYIEKMEG